MTTNQVFKKNETGFSFFHHAGVLAIAICATLGAAGGFARSDEGELRIHAQSELATMNETKKTVSETEQFAKEQIRQYEELMSALTERGEVSEFSLSKQARLKSAIEDLQNQIAVAHQSLQQLHHAKSGTLFLNDDLRASLFALQEAGLHAQAIVNDTAQVEY